MPRFITPDGCRLEFRTRGQGPLIALTPGGREEGEALAALAEALAPRACVLTWDRRNTGASDLFFGGEKSEQEIWAANRQRMLGLDPEAFAAIMKRWNRAFHHRPGAALAGVDDSALRTIRLPALIFEGNDDVHPAAVSKAMAALIPGAALLGSPWSRQDWTDLFAGRKAGKVFDLYPLLGPDILDFIAQAPAPGAAQ